jgi:signal transduction histidine kinase/CheY-like chemotaxis protein
MSDTNKQSNRHKPGLVPTTGLYGIIALILILALGFILTDSLSKISNLATFSRDKVLPTILNSQRTAVNIERLGRFAEIVYRSEDNRVRRQYKLAARILSHDSVFEDNIELNAKVMAAYREIELIAELRDDHDAFVERYEENIRYYLPGGVNRKNLETIPSSMELAKLMSQADRSSNMIELSQLRATFDKRVKSIKITTPEIRRVLEDAVQLFKIHQNIMETELRVGGLWKKVNDELETIAANLSTEAAVTADDSFTFIAEKADWARYTSLLAAATLMLSLITLLFFAQRNIVAPIIRSTIGLNQISQGERDIKLPEERLKELDDIRLAVERSSMLMAELADRTTSMEEANHKLEEEIKHRQKTQELLAEAKERAETADRAKSDFLAGMSHEIRTPMNTMIGMGELLLETDTTTKQREFIANIQSSGMMLLGIINDVLDLSKIEAGEVELDIVDINRDQFIERTRQIVAGRAELKGIDFVIDVDDDVPLVFRCDPTRLRQVLVNLIDNGVKFTEKGEVRLTIQRSLQEGPNALTFAVIDTGIGISEEAQRNIFHRFTQADTSTTREYGGTGLGLAICQRLVGIMGGTIQLESTPGQGTAFHFTLNLEPPLSPIVENRKQQKHSAPIGPLADTPLSILVAEDSESNRALIDLYFKRTACSLDFAVDGLEALEMFSKNKYDLILMDIQMPGMDGYEATQHIRAREKEMAVAPIPIVAVTANAFKEDQKKSQAAGCTDYLAKPVSKASLLECVAFHTLSDGDNDA